MPTERELGRRAGEESAGEMGGELNGAVDAAGELLLKAKGFLGMQDALSKRFKT